MKKNMNIGVLITLILVLLAAPVFAQSDSRRAADCSTYARNRAETEAPAGGGALGGAARGAARGALFGAIVGGGKGAGRGAALGGGLGAVRGGVRSSQQRDASFQYYYDECMRGRR
ncbi:MAG: hypothetical protein OEW04_02570 [Nitrospirota bacterium]|nr:hypothetical protein [Nitrospirota bacterium]